MGSFISVDTAVITHLDFFVNFFPIPAWRNKHCGFTADDALQFHCARNWPSVCCVKLLFSNMLHCSPFLQ